MTTLTDSGTTSAGRSASGARAAAPCLVPETEWAECRAGGFCQHDTPRRRWAAADLRARRLHHPTQQPSPAGDDGPEVALLDQSLRQHAVEARPRTKKTGAYPPPRWPV